MSDYRIHRGYGKPYAKFIHRFSKLSYFLFSGGGNFSELIFKGVELNTYGKFLDIGCGVGNLMITIQARINKENDILLTGIDRSDEMIKIASSRTRNNPGKVCFVVCDAMQLPFKTGVFDINFNILFLHHLPLDFKREVLAESYRVLKSEGKIILMDLDRPSSVMGWLIAFSRWHVSTIKTNCKFGLEYFFTKAGFQKNRHIKKLGIFSYYELKK